MVSRLIQEELVVTDEMIDVGCEAIQRFFGFSLDNPEKIVSVVFSAMWAAEGETVSADQKTGTLELPCAGAAVTYLRPDHRREAPRHE